MKMKKYLRNENGNIPFIPCFVVAMMVLLVSVMVYVTAEINCIHVRNTIKNELTNVSARISADTYKAMREGNLGEYYLTLTDDSAYKAELENLVVSKIESAMPLETDNYKIENIVLNFIENSDNIEYVLTCNVEYYVSLFGNARTIRAEEIELSGCHNIKRY